MTVRVLNKTFEEALELLADAGLTDHVVHGTQDGTVVYVTGEGDVLADVRRIGMDAVIC